MRRQLMYWSGLFSKKISIVGFQPGFPKKWGLCNLSSVHLSIKTKVSPRSFSVCCSALARPKRELELNKLGGNKTKPSNCPEKRDSITAPAKREVTLCPCTSWVLSTHPGEPTASVPFPLAPPHPIPRSLSYRMDLLEGEEKQPAIPPLSLQSHKSPLKRASLVLLPQARCFPCACLL